MLNAGFRLHVKLKRVRPQVCEVEAEGPAGRQACGLLHRPASMTSGHKQ
jgi:hypothetical protein